MNEYFENNEFFRQLPEETKEKIRNCKTEEDAMDVLKQDMIPIPDDVLEDVAGGGHWITNCPKKNTCSNKSVDKKEEDH